MLITKNNLKDINVLSFIHLYTQILHCLVYKNINIFGSTIRNWLGLCYFYNLNPTQFDSFVKLLDLYPELHISRDIDIWIYPNNSQLNKKDFLNMGTSLGYNIDSIAHISKPNFKIQKITFTSLFCTNQEFILKLYSTYKFDDIYTDIDQLYMKCTTENGIESLELLNNNVCTVNNSSFGFAKQKQQYIETLLHRISQKICLYKYNNATHSLNDKNKMINHLEKLYRDKFKIDQLNGIRPYYNTIKLSNNICSICIDSCDSCDSDTVITLCKHIFHTKCLLNWWKAEYYLLKWSCPNCRKTFKL